MNSGDLLTTLKKLREEHPPRKEYYYIVNADSLPEIRDGFVRLGYRMELATPDSKTHWRMFSPEGMFLADFYAVQSDALETGKIYGWEKHKFSTQLELLKDAQNLLGG